jgi:hypothetical protein
MLTLEQIAPPTVFILSAESDKNSVAENLAATKRLEEVFVHSNIPNKKIFLSYKGREELGFLVVGEEHEKEVLHLAIIFNQDGYVKSGTSRKSQFVGNGKPSFDLGKLKPSSKEVARSLTNWVYCPKLDQYYIFE